MNQTVNSSNIKRIGYREGTLYIAFKSGDVYSYDEVPLEVYEQLAAAESVGQAFHKLIKNVFNHSKVEYDPFPAPLLPEGHCITRCVRGCCPGNS